MRLAAKLTIGWADIPRSQFAAVELHSHAIAAPHYENSLYYRLKAADKRTCILGVDQLFRTPYGGLAPVEQLIGALRRLPTIASVRSPLLCEIDLFTYAFLASTHSFDRLLPITETDDTELAQSQAGCVEAIRMLKNFERTGFLPTSMSGLDAHQHLALRRLIDRSSARDEWRVLAKLLVGGPSTASSLERELTLNYTFAKQTLRLFESIGIFTRWGEEPDRNTGETIFAIDRVAIPLVLSCLRETLGLDLLSSLPALL